MKRNKSNVVAFQGELGAFSHSAARKLLGDEVTVKPVPTFETAFEFLKTGKVTHAVIPIENTLHGSIHENYDHLLAYNLPIVGETSIRISHFLIAKPGVRFRNVNKVFSHPVALNQCLDFFAKYRGIEKKTFYDTAGSVRMLMAEGLEDAAAIAGEAAAQIYGAAILKRNIEDDRKNFTRFFLLSRKAAIEPQVTGNWKTSLVFTTANTPGALFKSMACFALRNVNLIKIESRPLRGKPWEYLFYLDLNGHQEDPVVGKALANLGELTSFLKILGSYQPSA